MIDGNIDEFINMLYFGEDIYLIYNNKRLFIDGWMDNDIYTLRMIDYDDDKSEFNFEISNEDKNIVVQTFLNKNIWNNKSFYDEAKNIIWSEPFDK